MRPWNDPYGGTISVSCKEINSTQTLIHTLPEAAAVGCAASPAAPGDPRTFRLLFSHHRNPKNSTFGATTLAIHSGLCRKASRIGRCADLLLQRGGEPRSVAHR